MTGFLEEISLPDVVQLLSTNCKSGVLRVCRNAIEGRIYFRSGQIYFADLDAAPTIAPRQAVFRMLAWENGTFVFGVPETRCFANEIQYSTEGLLLEGLCQLDEQRRIDGVVPNATVPPFRRKRRTSMLVGIAAAAIATFCGGLWLHGRAGGASGLTHEPRVRADDPPHADAVDSSAVPQAPGATSAICAAPGAGDPVVAAAPRKRKAAHGHAVHKADAKNVEDTPAEAGFLIANTRPWAKVIIDGTPTGMTTPIPPRWKIPLRPGRHVVTFQAAGRDYPFDVVVRPGADLFLMRDLETAPLDP
jgi:Domain of unknown function (DUF4388)